MANVRMNGFSRTQRLFKVLYLPLTLSLLISLLINFNFIFGFAQDKNLGGVEKIEREASTNQIESIQFVIQNLKYDLLVEKSSQNFYLTEQSVNSKELISRPIQLAIPVRANVKGIPTKTVRHNPRFSNFKLAEFKYDKLLPIPQLTSLSTPRDGLVELSWKLSADELKKIDGFLITKKFKSQKSYHPIAKISKEEIPRFFDTQINASEKISYKIYSYLNNLRSKSTYSFFTFHPNRPTRFKNVISPLKHEEKINLISPHHAKRLVFIFEDKKSSDLFWIKTTVSDLKNGVAVYSLAKKIDSQFISLLNIYQDETYYHNDISTFNFSNSQVGKAIDLLTRGKNYRTTIVLNKDQLIFFANFNQNSTINYFPAYYEIVSNSITLIGDLRKADDANCCPTFRQEVNYLYNKENNLFEKTNSRILKNKYDF